MKYLFHRDAPTAAHPKHDAHRVATLPGFFLAREVADLCRRAYLELLTITARPVLSHEVVRWARGPYHTVLRRSGVHGPQYHVDAMLADLMEDLDAQLARSRTLLLWAVRQLASGTLDPQLRRTDVMQLVVRVRDRRGYVGFAPVTRSDMSFLERSAGLVFADLLSRAERTAHENETPSTQEHHRASRPSGIVLKSSEDTLPGLGEVVDLPALVTRPNDVRPDTSNASACASSAGGRRAFG